MEGGEGLAKEWILGGSTNTKKWPCSISNNTGIQLSVFSLLLRPCLFLAPWLAYSPSQVASYRAQLQEGGRLLEEAQRDLREAQMQVWEGGCGRVEVKGGTLC